MKNKIFVAVTSIFVCIQSAYRQLRTHREGRIPVLLFSVIIVASYLCSCSSDDDSKNVLSDYCYTGIVKYIFSETESVQVVITADPTIVTDRPVRGDMIVFASKDLTNSVLQVDDVVEFKIIEYEMVKSPGGPKIAVGTGT